MIRKWKLLIILAGLGGLCAACGPQPTEEPTPTESPAYIGSVHLRSGSAGFTCGGIVYQVVELANQTFTRPIVGVSYYTTTLSLSQNEGALPYAVLSFNCGQAFIPSAPICGDLNAICSETRNVDCTVYRRAPNSTFWIYSGHATMWSLTYQPLVGYTGNYITAADGPAISAIGCNSINFTLGA